MKVAPNFIIQVTVELFNIVPRERFQWRITLG